MEKFLYFRATSGVSGDQDETAGSVMYPVSSIKAIVAGDAADGEGTITDDDDRFTIFFEPGRIGSGSGGSATASADRPDHIVLDVTAGDFDFKGLYEELVGKINQPGAHSNGLITVFDGVTGTGISGITGIHQVTMNLVD